MDLDLKYLVLLAWFALYSKQGLFGQSSEFLTVHPATYNSKIKIGIEKEEGPLLAFDYGINKDAGAVLAKYDKAGIQNWKYDIKNVESINGLAQYSDVYHLSITFNWSVLIKDSIYESSNGYTILGTLNSSGQFNTLRQFSGSLFFNDYDKWGNQYISGNIFDSAIFNGVVKDTGQKTFVAKLDSSGSCIWYLPNQYAAQLIPYKEGFLQYGLSNYKLGVGNDYFLPPNDSLYQYVAYIKSNGLLVWLKQFHGWNIWTTGEIAIDPFDNIYLANSYKHYYYNGTCSVTSPNLTASIVKLNSNGDCEYIKEFKAPEDGTSQLEGLTTDLLGNVYVAGGFTKQLNLGDTVIDGGDYTRAFIMKFDANGNRRWVTTSAGKGGAIGKTVAVSGGNVYAAGIMGGEVMFDDKKAETYQGVFLVKIKDDDKLIDKPIQEISDEIKIYPNPSNGKVNLYLGENVNDYKIDLFSVDGRKILSTTFKQGSNTLSLPAYAKGVFFLHITSDGINKVEKILLD